MSSIGISDALDGRTSTTERMEAPSITAAGPRVHPRMPLGASQDHRSRTDEDHPGGGGSSASALSMASMARSTDALTSFIKSINDGCPARPIA